MWKSPCPLRVREDPSHVIAIRVGKLRDSVNPHRDEEHHDQRFMKYKKQRRRGELKKADNDSSCVDS
jgi:hypothetical protein